MTEDERVVLEGLNPMLRELDPTRASEAAGGKVQCPPEVEKRKSPSFQSILVLLMGLGIASISLLWVLMNGYWSNL